MRVGESLSSPDNTLLNARKALRLRIYESSRPGKIYFCALGTGEFLPLAATCDSWLTPARIPRVPDMPTWGRFPRCENSDL